MTDTKNLNDDADEKLRQLHIVMLFGREDVAPDAELAIEQHWKEQKGIEPDTGKMWLTPRMERNAVRTAAAWSIQELQTPAQRIMKSNANAETAENAEQPKNKELSSSILFSAGCCPECESQKLTWHADTKNYGGVQDGRICMREVGPIFFLGCDECSETLRIVDGDKVAAMLTEMQKNKNI